jgi:hypothetical protein
MSEINNRKRDIRTTKKFNLIGPQSLAVGTKTLQKKKLEL